MRKLIYISIILTFCSTGVFSQGAWNINYIPMDSLNNSFLGKEIRIDFKSSGKDVVLGKKDDFNVRRLLSKQDTVILDINGQEIKFIEQWRIYVDHGVLREQFLESLDGSSRNKIQIIEIFLESINDSSLTLEVKIYNLKNEFKANQKITVNRTDIKGVLFRNYD
jgi:hypothetical protein